MASERKAVIEYMRNRQRRGLKANLEAFEKMPESFKLESLAMVPLIVSMEPETVEWFEPLVKRFLATKPRLGESYFLLNYWLIKREFDKARALVEHLEKNIGPSVPTEFLFAIVANERGDRKLAYKHFKQLLDKNMDFEDAYWQIFDTLIYHKQYEEAVLTLKALENYFGYSFDGVDFDRPEMNDLVSSSAYKNWVSAR